MSTGIALLPHTLVLIALQQRDAACVVHIIYSAVVVVAAAFLFDVVVFVVATAIAIADVVLCRCGSL